MGRPETWRLLPASLAVLAFLILSLIPDEAHSLPFFARQVGRDCTFCHTVFPKLNGRGLLFRANGYRFEADSDEGWKEVKDISQIPLSMEIEIEGKYDNVKGNGLRVESSDLLIEELEFLSAGTAGKTGRLSYFGSFAIEETASGSAVEYETSIMKAFLQINDLLGRTGAGNLNLRAGQTELSLPFLGGNQRFINRAYFSESALSVLDATARVVELNGLITSGGGEEGGGDEEDEEEEERGVSHLYRAGISREGVQNDDKLKGFYASYALIIEDAFSFGLIYRKGEEVSGSGDVPYDKGGVAAEGSVGPVTVAAGLFSSKLKDAERQDNLLFEALYLPLKRLGLGIRGETLRERRKERAKSLSFMLRYNILSNAYALLELTELKDEDHLTSSNEEETRLRLFLTALF